MVKVRTYLAPISEGDSGKIKELEERIASLNNQINDYLVQIEDLESQINVKNTLLDEKTNEINAKVYEIGQLQGQITLLTSDKDTMQNNIDELTIRVSQLEEEVETLNSLIDDYHTQIESKDDKIIKLNDRIAELEDLVFQLENSGSSEELEAANARIAELEGQVTTLTNDKTTLQNQLTAANDQITELQNQIDNMDDNEMMRRSLLNILGNYTNCRYVTASDTHNSYITKADVQLRGKGYVLIITYESVSTPYADDSERPPCEWGPDDTKNKVQLILKNSDKSNYDTTNYYLFYHDNSYYWTKLPLQGSTNTWHERSYLVLCQEGAFLA